MNWTVRELRYLEEHAGDGVEAVAEALGRTACSVKSQAKRYGISLRRTYQCPRCGMRSRSPLSGLTGWCSACTKEQKRARIAEQVRELEEEVARNEREDRERQRLYSRKHRLKKKLELMTPR